MLITPLIEAKAELTDGGLAPEPIVLSTRIRLARNLSGEAFPGWGDSSQRVDILERCLDKLSRLPAFKDGTFLQISDLTELEKQVLVERHLVSRELIESEDATGVFIAPSQQLAVMINEEDHLRLQCMRSGFNFRKAWEEADATDSEMEDQLDYAFSDEYGYLTACPTNVGTGLRASAMLHLPGLVMCQHMEKVVRMVNQLGLAVRGSLGEGSEATGSIFQISNQQTLGESEDQIIKRLITILHAIIEQETNARGVLLENQSTMLMDKIGRAYGILRNGHLLSSQEAVNLLSLMRLAVDLGIFPEEKRAHIDRLSMEIQPGHVQCSANADIEPELRDQIRATRIREQFASFPTLDFSRIQISPNLNQED
ncbi:protein arginine kinase [Puniceicoccales bacterium CK1056]|uniref:Protein arginine kinase n=1 Tax=Oceanipulchritudo coccoides TaxID=2706888 RepID=A0A6B2LZ10_9BACT|nr:protein arginine kinase [Oceanipulchritudo coccoides]NDV61174.1 protein arginine kinase [Oceanipulchritudo coccoides]